MIQEKSHIALVVRRTKNLGMITLEDIIEELVGEIEDEFDVCRHILSVWRRGL